MEQGEQGREGSTKPTRNYKACAHCRERRSKCDLGDPNNPSDPPCARCRREKVECVFLPSRRRGRKPWTGEQAGDQDEVDERPRARARFASSEEPGLIASTSTLPDIPAMGAFDPPTSAQDTRHLAMSSLRNPVDALLLLTQSNERSPSTELPSFQAPRSALGAAGGMAGFSLVAQGIVTASQVEDLFELFFDKIHPLFYIIPATRIPRTPASCAAFAASEPMLSIVIALIASRYYGIAGSRIHQKIWEVAQHTLNGFIFLGNEPTTGAVEALLLLSEYLPIAPAASVRETNQAQERMSWMTVGNAVRIGYMLGLDQTGVDTQSGRASDERNRQRVAWIYSYSHDRIVSIQTGKTFWCRGPGLSAQALDPDPAVNFPALRAIPGVQDDFAASIQCTMQLTQTLSNAHDILYPSKDRTLALAKLESYYRYLEDFTTNLSAFQEQWKGKRWSTFPVTECVWVTFHYARLYIFGFAFQAHVQREGARATKLFPAGLLGCSDARHILQAIDAAGDVLRIAIDRLAPGAAVAYLPWRYFLWFSHAAVFLLKVAVTGALNALEKKATLKLIRRLISCLLKVAPDDDHPAARYGSLLRALLETVPPEEVAMLTREHTPDASDLLGNAGPSLPASRPVPPSTFLNPGTPASVPDTSPQAPTPLSRDETLSLGHLPAFTESLPFHEFAMTLGTHSLADEVPWPLNGFDQAPAGFLDSSEAVDQYMRLLDTTQLWDAFAPADPLTRWT